MSAMAKPSKKRTRTSDEDVAGNYDAKPVVKKSKLDSAGKAEAAKSTKVKEGESEPVVVEEVPNAKKGKKDKKEKKRRSKDVDIAAAEPEDKPATPSVPEPASESVSAAADGDSTADKKSKEKRNKKDKKTKPAKSSSVAEEPDTADPTSAGETGSKQTRFICFVGNLPYTATAASVQTHFASLQPTSVRLLTQRDNPSKSRGIAFVEFGRYDHMKTCLEKFHHTEFDDGVSSARRINVELTAGGGGKTAKRQDKIKQKNAKLNEERAHRMKEEQNKAKQEKAAKTQEQRDEEAIHPSRRGRVPYGKT